MVLHLRIQGKKEEDLIHVEIVTTDRKPNHIQMKTSKTDRIIKYQDIGVTGDHLITEVQVCKEDINPQVVLKD